MRKLLTHLHHVTERMMHGLRHMEAVEAIETFRRLEEMRRAEEEELFRRLYVETTMRFLSEYSFHRFTRYLLPYIYEYLREHREEIWGIPYEYAVLLTRYGFPSRRFPRLYEEILETHRPERRLIELPLIEIPLPYISIIDDRVLALIEKHLVENFPDDVNLAIQRIIRSVEGKTRFVDIAGINPGVARLAMQLYFAPYLERYMGHNAFAIRVTPLTYPHVENKTASTYIVSESEGQQYKPDHDNMPDNYRELRVKVLGIRKKPREHAVTRQSSTIHEKFTKQEKLPVHRDHQGKPLDVVLIWHAIYYRHVLKVFQARQTGYPEKRPWWQKPHIEVLITRKGPKIRWIRIRIF